MADDYQFPIGKKIHCKKKGVYYYAYSNQHAFGLLSYVHSNDCNILHKLGNEFDAVVTKKKEKQLHMNIYLGGREHVKKRE